MTLSDGFNTVARQFCFWSTGWKKNLPNDDIIKSLKENLTYMQLQYKQCIIMHSNTRRLTLRYSPSNKRHQKCPTEFSLDPSARIRRMILVAEFAVTVKRLVGHMTLNQEKENLRDELQLTELT